MNNPEKKPFFVGYLDMPKSLKKFYVPLTVFLILFSVGAGYTIASKQRSVGPAFWQNSTTETVTGLLRVNPYPVLHRFNPENPEQIESILLVNQGKYSSNDYASPFADQMVTITGYPIYRGGWSMLELIAEEPIQAINDNSETSQISEKLMVASKPTSLGPVALSGEIADSKCFLGVMKPGIGSVHKACAEVCLLGGIPAMLLAWGEDGQKYGYMLTQHDGSSISKEISKNAADYAKVTGELQMKGNLLYIQIAEKNGIQI